MIDNAALLDRLPAEASALLADERLIGIRDHADADKATEAALDIARARWRWENHTCPTPTEEWSFACEHLMSLWSARTAYQLAALGAPEDASGCGCDGSGVFYGRGYVENGVFKGHVGECFRC